MIHIFVWSVTILIVLILLVAMPHLALSLIAFILLVSFLRSL